MKGNVGLGRLTPQQDADALACVLKLRLLVPPQWRT